MGSYDVDDFVESIWPIIIIILVVISVCSCLCFACPCCPWYKRRRQGTVYQNITHPSNRVEIITTNNPTGYPITQQVTVTPNTIAYPVQQTIHQVQPIGVVQTSMPPYQPPPANFEPAMPHPYGQPPPYSEVVNMPGASAPTTQDAYAKQAPFNPYYGAGNH